MSSTIVSNESIEQSRSNSSLAALRYPAFRLYFAGQLVSVSGTWMQAVAQQVVVYNLTKSDFTLGLVACAQGLPALLLTPFAGVIVERYPKRKLLVLTQTLMMVLAFIMAFLQFTHVLQVWHIVALSFGLGMANALDGPARQAFVIEMVGKEHLSSGIVMNSIMFNGARIVGPAIGGLALATVGAGWCFFLNGISFLAVIASLLAMHVKEISRMVGRIRFIQPLKEGFLFARQHPTIGPLLLMSAVTSVFGITFATLIPSFAVEVLHDTSSGAGTSALLTAQGIGTVIAAIAVARANSNGKRGVMLVTMAIASPILIIIFAMTSSYVTSLPLIGLVGLAIIAQYVMINTLIQNEVPDEFRGRVLSLYTLTFFGFSPFSNLALGVLADSTSTPIALIVYNVICLVAIGLIVYRAPQLRKIA